MPSTASIRVTFGLPAGGEHVERLRINVLDLYEHAKNIARAARRAGKRGIKLGVCQHVVHRKCAVFLYTLDTAQRLRR